MQHQKRFTYNPRNKTLFLDLQGLKVSTKNDILFLEKHVHEILSSYRVFDKVNCLVNYDSFCIEDEVASEFADVCDKLTTSYYKSISRFTASKESRIKLKNFRKELKNRNVKDYQFGTMIGKFILKGKLGEGSFGVVKLAVEKETGKQVAVKIINQKQMDSMQLSKFVEAEVKALKTMDHPHIVHLLEVIHKEDQLFIFMEYAGESLEQQLEYSYCFDEDDAKKRFSQLVSAMDYLHNKKCIAHRDLQLSNICFDDEDTLKVVDFGTATSFAPEKKNYSLLCGNIAFAPPEMIRGEKYCGPEVDVWAMGVLLFKMVTGCLPFRQSKQTLQNTFSIPLEDENVSIDCKDLIVKMLTTDPEKRITVKEMKMHPWLHTSKSN